MDQDNIMFFKNQNESYTMVDLYLDQPWCITDFWGLKILAVIMILMLIKCCYLKKVIMNILVDIMM